MTYESRRLPPASGGTANSRHINPLRQTIRLVRRTWAVYDQIRLDQAKLSAIARQRTGILEGRFSLKRERNSYRVR